LILYETLDAAQIEDIMNGRKPRPPTDWTDNRPSGGSEASTGDGKRAGPIGGPAGEH
jgi:cell division protease FtsH